MTPTADIWQRNLSKCLKTPIVCGGDVRGVKRVQQNLNFKLDEKQLTGDG